MNTCGKCSAPTDTYLCWDCTKALRKILIELKQMVTQLEIQVTRQAVGAKSPGGKSAETPLIFDAWASESADIVFQTLAAWSEENPLGVDAYTRARRQAQWLVDNVVVLSQDENAADCLDEVTHALRVALRTIDRKANLIPLGVCDCGTSILARPWKKVVVCNKCDSAYDVQATRANLQQLGRDRIVTAQEAIALGELYGKALNRKTITTWVRRGKLQQGENASGVYTYRFGDLLDLCRERVADEIQPDGVEVER